MPTSAGAFAWSRQDRGNDQGKFGEITIVSDHPDLPPIKLMVQFAVVDE